MPIDPNIILGIKPIEIKQQDPLEQYGKGLTLQHLQQQSDMGQMALADDRATRDAYAQSGGDPATLRALLNKGGQYKAVQAFDKNQLENSKTNSEIGKNDAEILVKRTAAHRDQLANVNDPQAAAQWVAAGYNDPVLNPIVSKAGTLQDLISRIPQDPEGFNQWKQQNALGATKFIEMNKPTVHTQDLGGTSRVFSMPGLGGAPTTVSNTPITQSANSAASNLVTMRGQNMADARARDTLEQGKNQIVTDDNGNITLVNKNTGVGRPTVDGQGNPLKGKQNLTESQGKALGMATRAREANDILTKMELEGETNRGIFKQGVEHIPLIGEGAAMGVNMLPGSFGGPSAKQQQVEQARRNFVNAVLRVESGAAISQSEFQNAEKQYFPMPGDSKEVKEQKARNRETSIRALSLQSGNGAAKIPPPATQPDHNGITWDN